MSNYTSLKNEYRKIINEKLNDKQLRKNLSTGMDTLKNNRKKLIDSRFNDWESLREKGRQLKIKNLSKLDILLQKFDKYSLGNR